MMRFFHAALSVLSLLSVSQSAPMTSCDNLIQPFEDNGGERLLGKWILAARTLKTQGYEEISKRFEESIWFKITAANETDAYNVEGSTKIFGLCSTIAAKMTLENGTLRAKVPETSSKGNETTGEEDQRDSIKLLKTGCSDCLLIVPPVNIIEGGRSPSEIPTLMLLSKTGTVTAAELNEFEKQSECLNLRTPFSLNPKGDVCPELPPQDTEFTDHPRRFVNGQEASFQNFINSIVNAGGGPENLKKIVEEIYSSTKYNSSDHESVRAAD